MDVEQELNEIISEIKDGNKDKARDLLRAFIKSNPANEMGWWIYAKIAPNREQRIFSLEKVLEINPDNIKAGNQLRLDKESRNNIKSSRMESNSKGKTSKKGINPILVISAILAIIAVIFTSFVVFTNYLQSQKYAAETVTTKMVITDSAHSASESQIATAIVQTEQAISTPTIAVTSTIPIFPTRVQSNDNLKVSFIDVGQGDAILIRSPEGLFGLIDGGEQDSGVVDYLHSQGVQSLDLVVATHPHSDHIGGLIEVLNTFPTARVVTNGEMHTTLIYESFLDAIATSKAEYIEVTRGETVYLGGLNLEVLNPGPIIEGDQNRNSIVLRLAYGSTTILFTGDASRDTEAEMIAAGLALGADILKVGHHGSNSATSSEFVALVHPAVAVYSAGKGNSYGHPSPDTLARLSGAGAQVFGTDVNGTIIFDIDETGYSVQTIKEGLSVPITDPYTTPDSQAGLQEEISISVVSLNSPISAGSNAKLTIQTVPGAVCSITVYYKSGPSSAAGLGSQTADASGQATWSWKVGSRTTPGIWKIVVQSNLNNKSASISIPFEVK